MSSFSELESDSALYENIVGVCKKIRCKAYSICHSPFQPTKNDLKKLSRCRNEEVSNILHETLVRHINLKAQREKELIDLQNAVSQELLKAAFEIEDESTERYILTDAKAEPRLAKDFEEINDEKTSQEYAAAPTSRSSDWWNEIRSVYESTEKGELSADSKELLKAFASQHEFTANDFKCSFNLAASGVLTGTLLPNISQENANNFRFSPKLLDSLVEQLNSGEVVLRDTHERSVRSILGVIKKAWKNGTGGIDCEAEVEDEGVSRMLRKRSKSFGLSICGAAEGKVTCAKAECSGDVSMETRRCKKCGSDRIIVHPPFRVKEVSLTDSPAYSGAKISSYKEDTNQDSYSNPFTKSKVLHEVKER